jgi:hypothetical protein
LNFLEKKKRKTEKEKKRKERHLTEFGLQSQTIVLEGAMLRARCHRQALGKLSYAQWKAPERAQDLQGRGLS